MRCGPVLHPLGAEHGLTTCIPPNGSMFISSCFAPRIHARKPSGVLLTAEGTRISTAVSMPIPICSLKETLRRRGFTTEPEVHRVSSGSDSNEHHEHPGETSFPRVEESRAHLGSPAGLRVDEAPAGFQGSKESDGARVASSGEIYALSPPCAQDVQTPIEHCCGFANGRKRKDIAKLAVEAQWGGVFGTSGAGNFLLANVSE